MTSRKSGKLAKKVERLTPEQVADARFRAKDRAWLAVAELFDTKAETAGLTYQAVAERVGRTKAQVHRWIDTPGNMTLASLGLLAEGLDADLSIKLTPTLDSNKLVNYCHPAVMAEAYCQLRIVPVVRNATCMAAPTSSARVSKQQFFVQTEALDV